MLGTDPGLVVRPVDGAFNPVDFGVLEPGIAQNHVKFIPGADFKGLHAVVLRELAAPDGYNPRGVGHQPGENLDRLLPLLELGAADPAAFVDEVQEFRLKGIFNPEAFRPPGQPGQELGQAQDQERVEGPLGVLVESRLADAVLKLGNVVVIARRGSRYAKPGQPVPIQVKNIQPPPQLLPGRFFHDQNTIALLGHQLGKIAAGGAGPDDYDVIALLHTDSPFFIITF